MIHKVGLLPRYNLQQVPFAYKMYATADDNGWKQSNAFKKTFSNDVDIEFVGVWLVQVYILLLPSCSPFKVFIRVLFNLLWLFYYLLFFFRDTVNSVGLIPHSLPFTTSNTVVNTFRHAVSLDERRAKFKANLWNRPQKHEQLLSISDQKVAEELAANKGKSSTNTTSPHHRKSLQMLEGQYGKTRTTPTDIDEVTVILFLSTFCFEKTDSFFYFIYKGLVYWMPLW